MKILAIKKQKEQTNLICDGYIVPLEKFSVSYSLKYSLKEIQKIIDDESGKEIFVVINKNIFNDELAELENILTALNNMEINGVMFYDLSILSLVRKNNLDLTLIWNQTHMVTNYNTINYYFKKGVEGAFLSNEITKDEMIEIRKNTDSRLMVNLIYKPVMSFSRRHLLSNYYKTSSISDVGNRKMELVIKDKISNSDYYVIEEKDGTSILHGKIVNAMSAFSSFKEEGFDYGVVDLSCMDDEVGVSCLNSISEILKDFSKYDEWSNKISDKINEYTGFLYKKTIYKVK